MVSPATGAVVLVPFPFSDLSQSKLRPAVVVAEAGRGDWILCQVTSNPYGDARAIALSASDLRGGALRATSFVRPGKLFTASESLLVAQVATLSEAGAGPRARGDHRDVPVSMTVVFQQFATSSFPRE